MKAAQLDIRELLTINPQGGVIRFLGQRTYLVDAIAQGLHRQELIAAVGQETARMIFTRASYAHGWRAAEMVKTELPDIWSEAKDGKVGPMLSAFYGFGDVEKSIRTDGTGNKPLVETVWKNSFEAEQYLIQVGQSDEAVCWRMTGFASGYVSFLEGREVFFIEDKCVAKGDKFCRIVGKFREQWGDEIEQHLPYYQMKSVETVCGELSKKLHLAEKCLQDYKRNFAFVPGAYDDSDAYAVAKSVTMQRTIDLALRVAEVESSVLITGESGVGKERMAHLIHDRSTRSSKPFLAVNCGALTDTLLDSELFGHAKGAFTGAERDRIGLFEEAAGGTLLLDEVGDISPAMQVKLLRVLQEKEIRRVGENLPRPIDVRVLSATNRNLQNEVMEGRFRQDLFYRLKVIELNIPPLRERPDDILVLARLFMNTLAKSMKKQITGFTHKAADRLLYYEWPGNIRELQNAIEYAVVLCRNSQIDAEDLPLEIRSALLKPTAANGIRPLESIERDYILSVLQALGNNKAQTAIKLDISLGTLYRKLKEYGESEQRSLA